MKPARSPQNLIFLMPILCVATSVGIVLQESVRHDILQRQVAATEGQYAALEKRYNALRHTSGAQSSPAQRHVNDHHDGDGG